MKELKVGERITITLETIEEKNCLPCEECFFASFGNGCIVKDVLACNFLDRSDGKNVIFKEVKKQKRKMKEDKYSLKISRNFGDTTLDGYPIATYSNDELKILKRLLTEVLGEVNEYIKE